MTLKVIFLEIIKNNNVNLAFDQKKVFGLLILFGLLIYL